MSEENERRVNLAELRHSLRTPLNHILGYSEMLLEDAEREGWSQAIPKLQFIHATAQRILDCVQTYLVDRNDDRQQAVEALRQSIHEPVLEVVNTLGGLIQTSAAAVVGDLLRISTAAADLLAFALGKPLASDSAPGLKTPQIEVAEGARTGSGTLLVIDDNESNLDMVSRQLARMGYTIVVADNGLDGLSLLLKRSFDLVLLDIMMPQMDGVEVLRRIKTNPATAHVPVIMLSALDELSGVAYCIEHGAEDYLLKPFEPVLLRARLGATLDRKRMRDAERQRTLELERVTKQLERSNDDLKGFAYAASHDLQAPLRTMTSYGQLLERKLRDRLQPDERDLIHYLVDSGKRMSELTRDLLSYSQASTRKTTVETVNTGELVAEIVLDLTVLIEESNAKVTWSDLPEIAADRIHLRQVFQNLIINAIKYHGEEAPRVEVTAERENKMVHFRVSDNGVGIDPKYNDFVFEMFRRLHGHDRPGTGLGLAIGKRVVERMGGRIWVESQPGIGSTFHFVVPASGGDKEWEVERRPAAFAGA